METPDEVTTSMVSMREFFIACEAAFAGKPRSYKGNGDL
jgi:hypothetical protein